MSTISPTQRKALEYATESVDGRLFRWPGGYWTDDPWLGQHGQPRRWVGTQTVEALRQRGLVSPVEGAALKRGQYIIVQITSAGINAKKGKP